MIDGILFAGLYFLLESFTGYSYVWDVLTDLLWICYSVYFHGKYGQTPGKFLMKIKVVDHLNEAAVIGYQRALLREIGTILFILIGGILHFTVSDPETYDISRLLITFGWLAAELLTMWFNQKRRAIHDLIAGSVVIDIAQPTEWEKKYYYGGKGKSISL